MPKPARPERRLPGRQQEARLNDSAVLAAAREVFFARGHDASMAEIARGAGVGVGSIYRRYPTKEALVEALRVNAVSEAAVLAREVVAGADAASGPSNLPCAPNHRGHRADAPTSGRWRPDVSPTWQRRLRTCARASPNWSILTSQAGFVPEGFTTADVMQLLLHMRPALPFARERSDALHLRYLDLAMRGLREQAQAGVSDREGPHWEEWLGTWQD